MRPKLSETNMDALNRSIANMDMRSRAARVESHHRGLEGRHHDDRDRYDEDHINSRNASTRCEPRGRHGMESRHLDDMDEFDEEGIYPRRSTTRGGPREIGFEAMDRPSPNNILQPLTGGHKGSRSASSDLSLAKVLVQHDKARREQKQGEEAMLRSSKGSMAYNEGLEQRYQAKLRLEQLTKEIFKHDPNADDMDRAQRIAAHLYSESKRQHKTGRSSRSHRGSTLNRTGDHGRREHTAGRGGGHDPRHGHAGRSRDIRGSDFY